MNVLPTLSSRGNIRSTLEIIDALLSYFFLSMASQSYLDRGNVKSVQYIVAKYGDDELMFVNHMRESLTQLFNSQFKKVTVEVRVDDKKPGHYYIDITVIDKRGKKHRLNELVRRIDSMFQRITTAANETGAL
jgi:hypothetical protein